MIRITGRSLLLMKFIKVLLRIKKIFLNERRLINHCSLTLKYTNLQAIFKKSTYWFSNIIMSPLYIVMSPFCIYIISPFNHRSSNGLLIWMSFSRRGRCLCSTDHTSLIDQWRVKEKHLPRRKK